MKLRCSFCGKDQHAVRTLFKGLTQKESMMTVYICDDCVRQSFSSNKDTFFKLWHYIRQNNVAMTSPLESGAKTAMMIMYIGKKDARQPLSPDPGIKMRILPPTTVISIGMRGAYTHEHHEEGLQKIKQWLAKHPEWQPDGESFGAYWDLFLVPAFLKTSEVHQPVRKKKQIDAARVDISKASAF